MQSSLTLIEPELAPGERIIWSGRPKGGFQWMAADLFLIPFGLAWLAFAVFWTATALRIPKDAQIEAMSILFPLAGIPFILVGLYLVAGRYWIDARQRASTAYGITDRRVLAIRGGKRPVVRSFEHREIAKVNVTERKDRSGSIHFVAAPHEQRTPARWEMLPNVREVETLLTSARSLNARN